MMVTRLPRPDWQDVVTGTLATLVLALLFIILLLLVT